MREMDVDGYDQFALVAGAALADDIVGELIKYALGEVHPGGASKSEVNVNAAMPIELNADRRMFVDRVVVDDKVQGQSGRDLAVDYFEDGKPFEMDVPRSCHAVDVTV